MVKFETIQQDLKKKRLFIFDFDETLVNLNIKWDQTKSHLTQMVKERFGKDINFTPILEQLEFLKTQISSTDYLSIDKFLIQDELNALRHYSTIQNVGFSLLKNIYIHIINPSKSSRFIAILSNNYTETLKEGTKRYGIDQYISYYLGRDKVTKIKPNIEGLKNIHDQFPNIPKKEIVYFGDSAVYDKITAETYGIDFYLIRKGS